MFLFHSFLKKVIFINALYYLHYVSTYYIFITYILARLTVVTVQLHNNTKNYTKSGTKPWNLQNK